MVACLRESHPGTHPVATRVDRLMKYVDQKLVVENFVYQDGHLYWRVPKPARTMNKALGQGKPYLGIGFMNRQHKVHRLVWTYFHGHTDLEIDHIDRNKMNNRIENLRAVDRVTNQNNTAAVRKSNTSGYKGVNWHKGKWYVRARVNGKRIAVGRFDDIIEAARAYDQFVKANLDGIISLNFPEEN